MSELLYDTGAAGYDRMFAHVTQQFIPTLLGGARLGPGQYVLDIATGTGLAAEAAAGVVAPTGYVVAADMSASMLEQARRRLAGRHVGLTASDGQALAFRDGSFDAVLCQLGLIFFPAPERGLAEFRRVLRLGGRAAVAVLTTPGRSLFGRVNIAIARHIPGEAAAADRLFSLGNSERLRQLFEDAGFGDVETVSEMKTFTFPSFDAYFENVECGRGSSGQKYQKLSEEARGVVRAEVQHDLGDTGGPIKVQMEVRFGSGRRGS